MNSTTKLSRRSFVLGGTAALGVVSCSGNSGQIIPSTSTPASVDRLYELMRKTGVDYITSSNLNVILPEKQSTHPEVTCLIGPASSSGRLRPMSTCTETPPPIIITVYSFADPILAGGNGGSYGSGGLDAVWGSYGGGNLGPSYVGAKYGTAPGAWNCFGDAIKAGLADLITIASQIKNAQNAITVYGPNTVKAATWFLSGLITAGEFGSLLLTYCGPAELLAVVATVGITMWILVDAVKCAGALDG